MKRVFVKVLKWLILFDLAVLALSQIAKRLIPEVGDEHSDLFQIVCITGGREWRSEAPSLRSGTAITALGGLELDLRAARLDPGGAHLHLFTLMGGVRIRVPADWRVDLGGSAILAGHDFPEAVGVPAPGAPRLVIDATTIMGGVQAERVLVEARSH